MGKLAAAWALLPLLSAGVLFHPLTTLAGCRLKAISANSEVTLTQTHTKAWIQIPTEVAANPRPFLQVAITRIVNTARTPFSVFVYLERLETQPDSPSRNILLANFTVYPPEQPGTYVLRVSDGFRRLQTLGVTPGQDQAVVLLEMKRISEKSPWTPIEVTIAPLRWREAPER